MDPPVPAQIYNPSDQVAIMETVICAASEQPVQATDHFRLKLTGPEFAPCTSNINSALLGVTYFWFLLNAADAE